MRHTHRCACGDINRNVRAAGNGVLLLPEQITSIPLAGAVSLHCALAGVASDAPNNDDSSVALRHITIDLISVAQILSVLGRAFSD